MIRDKPQKNLLPDRKDLKEQIKRAVNITAVYVICLFIYQKYLGEVALTENSNSYLSDTSWVPEV